MHLQEEFAEKVNNFVASLPGPCKWVGTWNVSGDVDSTIIIETDNADHL